MADIRKFLDAAGVSALWSEVVTAVDAKVAAEAAIARAAEKANADRLTAAESKITALEAGTYDDTEVRNLIAGNTTAIKGVDDKVDVLVGKVGEVAEGKTVVKMIEEAQAAATYNDTEVRGLISDNADAIAVLNGDASVTGSVANTASSIAAAKVAEVVANADADFDTLKEIADWILNDTTGAANMANDIAALQGLVGDVAVATQIANAITAALKVDGVDKYALASDLTALAGRVQALEDAGYQNASQVGSAIDAKIAALNLAENYDAKGAAAQALVDAKSYADGLAADYDASGAAAQALTDAKAYADGLAGNYDTKGAAAAAESAAKSYADGLASNYATAAQGAKADTAVQPAALDAYVTKVAAPGYGDILTKTAAVDMYDVKGAAKTAEDNAKAYVDGLMPQALTTSEILKAIGKETA